MLLTLAEFSLKIIQYHAVASNVSHFHIGNDGRRLGFVDLVKRSLRITIIVEIGLDTAESEPPQPAASQRARREPKRGEQTQPEGATSVSRVVHGSPFVAFDPCELGTRSLKKMALLLAHMAVHDIRHGQGAANSMDLESLHAVKCKL